MTNLNCFQASRFAQPTVVLLAGCVLTFVGCDTKPRAPALSDSPVYQNKREGIRFLVPDGWTQSASSDLPPRIEGDVLLVRYKMKTPGQSASVEIRCFDEDEPTDLSNYHAEPSHAVAKWKLVNEESIEINEANAKRLAYIGVMRGKRMTKEVVAFRRDDRVYSFLGLFWSSDEKARQQLRRAIDSVIWN